MRTASGIIVFVASLAAGPAFADPNAVVVYVQGTVTIIKTDGSERAAALGSEVSESDTLATGAASQVRVRLFDKSLVRLGQASKAQMSQLRFDGAESKSVSVKLMVGKLWASVSKLVSAGSRFEVSTQSAVAGVRGTEFAVLLGSSGDSSITTAEGSVAVRANDGSERIVGAGFEAIVGTDGFRDLRAVSSDVITALRDESRGHGENGVRRDADRGDAIAGRLDRAMDAARERMDREGGREQRGGDRQDRGDRGDRGDRAAGDRAVRAFEGEARPAIGAEQSVVELSQRAADVFEQINERAATTRLNAVIELRDP